MDPADVLGAAAGVLTSCASLPQLAKIIKSKHAVDVSLSMILTLIAGLILWVAYGLLRQDWPVIATNSLSVGLNGTLLVYRIKYGAGKNKN